MSELHNSYLGSKEHWDTVYVTELENFKENSDNVGEIWYGERSEDKIMSWIQENVASDQTIVDVGTGNGHLLTLLAEEGFTNLTGIDYSPASIALASAVNAGNDITFECRDFLSCPGTKTFDLCLDKGTYDAVSLSESSAEDRIRYKSSLRSMLTPLTGRFLLASGNWTVEELKDFFSDTFTLDEIVPCKQFTFGGVTGQDVSIVIFKHRT